MDVDEQWTIPDHMPYTKSKWTPFSGMRVTGKVKRVVLRNQLVLIDGKVRTRVKADCQSVQFSERAEILLFAGENVALKLNKLLRLGNFLLSKIPPARKIPLTGNWALRLISSQLNFSSGQKFYCL